MAVSPDRVSIELDGQELLILKEYEVSQCFLTQPAAVSIKLGRGTVARELLARYPAGTPYKLYVGEVLQHSGTIDGVSSDDSGGATELHLRGRDSLAPLHDDHVVEDESFSNLTYAQLAAKCIEASGIAGYSIVFDNTSNRAAIADVPITISAPLLPIAAAAAQRAGLPTEGPLVVDFKRNALRAKVGETRYGFLEQEFRRAGLFLFAGRDENVFVLTTPTLSQTAFYEVVRQRGATRNINTVLGHRFRNDTTRRYSEYVVHGRGGGGVGGRAQIKGVFVDEELKALGIKKRWAKVDKEAKSQAQAEFLARRQCAEDRRRGWMLSYTLKGHTAPSLLMPGQRCIWTIDTLVRVRDDELGLSDDYWLEGVTFRGSAQNNGEVAEIVLMRQEDLVFGDDPDVAAKQAQAIADARTARIAFGGT